MIGKTRWAQPGKREREALYRYEYVPGNLSLRLRENELLALPVRFDAAVYRWEKP